MSPRLLRPLASGVHPEAAAWRSAVIANGGSVSATTMRAVSTFCASVEKEGLRSKLTRVNLMCGSNLNAVLVPLFRATSRTGTPLGNATDTNDNFVSGDYAETSGLVGNLTSKRLATGLARNNMTASVHVGTFAHARGTSAFKNYIRVQETAAGTLLLALMTWDDVGDIAFLNNDAVGNNGNSSLTDTHVDGDFLLGCVSASGAGNLRLLINGVQASTGAGVDSSAGTAPFTVFARQNGDNSVWSEHNDARIGGYTIGSNLTNSEAATYHTIWDTFLKALGRR
jgi:hypothetical protein